MKSNHLHIQDERIKGMSGNVVIDEISLGKALKISPPAFSKIIEHSEKGDCLIFHARISLLSSLPFLLFNKVIKRNKIAYQPHTNLRPTSLNKAFLSLFVDKIIFLTETNQNEWGTLGRKKGKVIPNPIPIKRLESMVPSTIKKQYDFVWAGRNVPVKRMEIFINAVKKAGKVTALVLTDRMDEEKRILIEETGGRIIFCEGKQNSDFFKEFSKGKVFVFTSTDEEGFPVILLESMYLNMPIICPDLPKFREILRGEGIYFKNDENLSQIMTSIVAKEFSPKLISKLVFMKYLPEEIISKYNDI